MNFFKLVGLTPISFSESNHGEISGTPIVSATSTSVVDAVVIMGDTPVTTQPAHHSPDDSTNVLTFGSNIFESHQLVVSKGFFIEISWEFSDIINLFLHRTHDEPLRIAQVVADIQLRFRDKKLNAKMRKGKITLLHGIYALDFDEDDELLEFYFLSTNVY